MHTVRQRMHTCMVCEYIIRHHMSGGGEGRMIRIKLQRAVDPGPERGG
jgi:hypothetical protein